MRYGYWLPVFGGWLRNVDDEGMQANWSYVSRLARRSEEIGYNLTLIAELNLNDIKGPAAPSMDAWSTAAALAAVTYRLELMVAVRPNFHLPALLAKQAANIDHISNGRLSLNVVSSWWADEAGQYGVPFEQHDDRYARTAEWLRVLNGVWSNERFSHSGRYFTVENTSLAPKPVSRPRPILYAGGESEAAKEMIARDCDAYVMHGDAPDRIRQRVDDLSERRARAGSGADAVWHGRLCHRPRYARGSSRRTRPASPTCNKPLRATEITSNGWRAPSSSNRFRSKTIPYSNRGLTRRARRDARAGGRAYRAIRASRRNLLLLQSSPQFEEMERFATEIIRPGTTQVAAQA